ncbi:RIP metalloprotease RseP [Candidatus Tisiphia endosymbiont of Nemotelus uliginosus]|uniref:RIP metalloprotease RseP n=1 Tax=Candidatus Tisiphia endosymbiont of Nemotelus uliginosus TaxID=3077926 RepID=UPI0035C8AC49
MLSLFGYIITISILVFIHEFGHYYVARLCGMKIEVFAIGFGKELFSRVDQQGVKWKICSLPFGGYVKIHGFDSTAYPPEQKIDRQPGAFRSKPLYAQFLTVIAGPIANYVLAILIFTTLYCYYGQLTFPPVVDKIEVGSPAEKANLQENDRIIMMDNKKIKDFATLQRNLLLNNKPTLNLSIVREGKIINISVAPEKMKKPSKDNNTLIEIPYIGVIAKNEPVLNKLNILQGIYKASIDAINISHLILKTLGQMIIGTRPLELAGPITIAQESGKSLSYGIVDFALFIAMISINLGLLNLLPIPVFDGGHLMFIIYEGIFGKALNQHVKTVMLKTGMLIIIFLIVFSISNDIKNLIH